VVLDYPWLVAAGYDVQKVDACLKIARLRLAALTPDIEFSLYGDA
jgi:hypothetical protein